MIVLLCRKKKKTLGLCNNSVVSSMLTSTPKASLCQCSLYLKYILQGTVLTSEQEEIIEPPPLPPDEHLVLEGFL